MQQSTNIESRRQVVSKTIDNIRNVMDDGPTVKNLERGRDYLIALAARRDLFSFDAFPLPTDDAMECSYLIHEYDNGSYSLYVNSGVAHQYYAPHDHGDAWAIIAAVQGRERHQLYSKRKEGEPGEGPLRKKGEIIVEPGNAVTMQPDGIHEVNVMDGKSILHLHLYAKNFVEQGVRWKYDLDQGLTEPFLLDELGSIIDAR